MVQTAIYSSKIVENKSAHNYNTIWGNIDVLFPRIILSVVVGFNIQCFTVLFNLFIISIFYCY
jgi:hypothetical protein